MKIHLFLTLMALPISVSMAASVTQKEVNDAISMCEKTTERQFQDMLKPEARGMKFPKELYQNIKEYCTCTTGGKLQVLALHSQGKLTKDEVEPSMDYLDEQCFSHYLKKK